MNIDTKAPPQAVEMEATVLGAILREDTAIHRAIGILKPDSFYDSTHRFIYEVMSDMFQAKRSIDVSTVRETCKTRPKEMAICELDLSYLSELSGNVVNTTKLEEHIRYIEEKAIARREINISSEKIGKLYLGEDDVFEVLNTADAKSYEARNSINAFKDVSPEKSADDLEAHVEQAMKNEGLTGVPTGIHPLDNTVGGWQPGHSIIIAARPAHGKSAVASFCQYHHALSGNPSVFFSMEMSTNELWSRITAIRIREMGEYITYEDIFFGNLNQQQLTIFKEANSFVRNLPIIIDDTPHLSSMQLKAKLMKYRNDYGVNSAYLDYIQLADVDTGRKGTRAQNISDYMTDVKGMCQDFKMPIVTLSQVDREVEKHGKVRRVGLSDLKDSGGLEEKADLVIAVFRPDAVATEETPVMEGDEGMIELNIIKRKMGKKGLIRVPMDIATNSFIERGPQHAMFTITADELSKPNNFIIRPSSMMDDDDNPPF